MTPQMLQRYVGIIFLWVCFDLSVSQLIIYASSLDPSGFCRWLLVFDSPVPIVSETLWKPGGLRKIVVGLSLGLWGRALVVLSRRTANHTVCRVVVVPCSDGGVETSLSLVLSIPEGGTGRDCETQWVKARKDFCLICSARLSFFSFSN